MVNPISFPMPQAFSGGVDFSPLANLGNVYRQAQERDQLQQALSRFGNNPATNAQLAVTSGVPSLAELGLRMQGQQATQAENVRQFNVEQALKERNANLAREKFEADDPAVRLQNWTKLNPGKDPNSAEAQAYAFQQPGLLANERIPAAAQKTLLANEGAIPQAQDVIQNLDTLAGLSPDATSGVMGQLETKYLGGLGQYTPEAVKKTQQMQQLATMNVLQQVKALFPGRVLQSEFKTLQALEHPEYFSDEVRQQSYKRLRQMTQDRLAEMQRENEGIRTGTIFKPGYKPAPSAAETTVPTTTGTTPAPSANLSKPPDRVLNQAKAAIAQGADPKAVRQRLIDNGHDPGDIGK